MFSTGQVIKGKVVVNNQQDFQGTEIVLGLNGSELTYFRKASSDRDNMYHSKFVFCNASHTIHKMEEPLIEKGTHSFAFEFRVPEWLPSSTIYNAEFQSSNLKIRYGIWAQIKPLNVNDYVDSKKTISIFRCSKEIYLFRPKVQVPIVDTLIGKVVSKVGGLMGLGGDYATTEIVFDRNQFYAGDTVNVRIICDNSQCSTAIKSFKFKLKRKVFASGELVS